MMIWLLLLAFVFGVVTVALEVNGISLAFRSRSKVCVSRVWAMGAYRGLRTSNPWDIRQVLACQAVTSAVCECDASVPIRGCQSTLKARSGSIFGLFPRGGARVLEGGPPEKCDTVENLRSAAFQSRGVE